MASAGATGKKKSAVKGKSRSVSLKKGNARKSAVKGTSRGKRLAGPRKTK